MDVQSVTQTTQQTERFLETYYRLLSSSTPTKFYRSTSKVIWNGNGYTGEQFKQMLPAIQKQCRKFEIRGFDVHALGSLLLVNVSGLVRIDRNHGFAQNFVLERVGGLTYIQDDCFRLI